VRNKIQTIHRKKTFIKRDSLEKGTKKSKLNGFSTGKNRRYTFASFAL
jgi:hypothetical protein